VDPSFRADLQEVKISLRVLYRPDKKRLAELYDKYGADYDERFLPSLGNEVLKAVVVRTENRSAPNN